MKKQIKRTVKKTVPTLSKQMKDKTPHNFVLYVCLKNGVSINSLKPAIMFIKSKNIALSDIEIKSLEEVSKKDYKYKVASVLLYCNAQEYITFKSFLSKNFKKNLIGNIEPTQKDIEKYCI